MDKAMVDGCTDTAWFWLTVRHQVSFFQRFFLFVLAFGNTYLPVAKAMDRAQI